MTKFYQTPGLAAKAAAVEVRRALHRPGCRSFPVSFQRENGAYFIRVLIPQGCDEKPVGFMWELEYVAAKLRRKAPDTIGLDILIVNREESSQTRIAAAK